MCVKLRKSNVTFIFLPQSSFFNKFSSVTHSVVSDTNVKVKKLFAQSCPTRYDPMDCTHQVPLSMKFSRQEYQSGQLFPSPGDLTDPGIEPASPALQADSLPTELRCNKSATRPQADCDGQHDRRTEPGLSPKPRSLTPLITLNIQRPLTKGGQL